MEVKTIPTDWCTKYLFAGWALASRNYMLIVIVYIVLIVVQVLISRIPGVGSIVASLLGSFLGIGCMVIQRDIVKGEKSDFQKLFTAFSEPGLLERMWPYFVFMILVAVPNLLMTGNHTGTGNLGLILLYSLITLPFTMFTGMIMYFNKLTLLESVKLSATGVVHNIIPLIYLFVISVVAAFVATICLVLPLFLVLIPAIFTVGYMIYASIFEGLNVPELHARLTAEDKATA